MKVIHKIAAIVIRDNKFLLVRKQGKKIWTNLGGRPEQGETEEECVLREIKEEIGVSAKIIKKLGDFEAKAIFDDAIVQLSAYLVKLNKNIPDAGRINHIDPELDEYKFISKDYKEKNIKIPPSLEESLIPFCVNQELLDW